MNIVLEIPMISIKNIIFTKGDMSFIDGDNTGPWNAGMWETNYFHVILRHTYILNFFSKSLISFLVNSWNSTYTFLEVCVLKVCSTFSPAATASFKLCRRFRTLLNSLSEQSPSWLWLSVMIMMHKNVTRSFNIPSSKWLHWYVLQC